MTYGKVALFFRLGVGDDVKVHVNVKGLVRAELQTIGVTSAGHLDLLVNVVDVVRRGDFAPGRGRNGARYGRRRGCQQREVGLFREHLDELATQK